MTTTDWTSETSGTGAVRRRQRHQPLLRDPRRRAGRWSCSTAGSARARCSGPALPALAAGHQVILPDLQGHGRTADIDRPIDVRLMADDIGR